ncbi:hypothetical protein ACOMHN_010349 [Nucella lapillus]
MSSPLPSHSIFGKYHSNHGYGDGGSLASPRTAGPQSPLLFCQLGQGSTTTHTSNGTSTEVQRLRDELTTMRGKMAEWEGVYTQAKTACEAWRREAEECTKRSKLAEEEKLQAAKQRDEALGEIQRSRQDGNYSPFARCLPGPQETEALSVETLQQLRHQIQLDLNLLDQVIFRKLQQRSVRSS